MDKDLILVLHHNDRDGILSATSVYIYYNDWNCNMAKVKFISADYSNSISDLLEPYKDIPKEIYIVDYSISNDKNADDVIALSEKYKVTWIDHHDSSIKYMQTCTEARAIMLHEIPGLRVKGIAACALTYIYMKTLHISNTVSNKECLLLKSVTNPILSVKNILEFDYSDIDVEIGKDSALALLNNLKVPPIILMAHRYDIWDLDDYGVLVFSYGENITDPTDYTLRDAIRNRSTGYVNRCKEKGSIICDYVRKEDEINKDQNGFSVTIKFIDMSKRGQRKEKTYTAIAMNTTHFSSLAFGDSIDEYDICIPFKYNGEKYIYSMYTNKENINVGELCTCLGGGGHSNAAGFTSSELFFKKNTEFEITKI